MAKISVLMPVFNVEVYVAEALASIQSQTFTDIEIVVVDDGSTDCTPRIVEQFASADPRIILLRTPRNLGLSAALNFGLAHCHAPFIARMDGDDIALPTRLEKQLQYLEKNPGVALVGCATMAIDQSGRAIPGLRVSRKPARDEEIANTMLLASPCLHIWLARSELYAQLSGYREMATAEDYDFLLRAISAGFRVSNIPEPLMLIRRRAGNLSSRLEQRKAHYYIIHLYRERIRLGYDSFSAEAYQRAIRLGKIECGAFDLAVKCIQKGLESRNFALRWLLPVLSAVLSPWQARYFLDRIRFRVAMRMSARECG
jgi:glycosyltransferase involved in cell wall biosynthesis